MEKMAVPEKTLEQVESRFATLCRLIIEKYNKKYNITMNFFRLHNQKQANAKLKTLFYQDLHQTNLLDEFRKFQKIHLKNNISESENLFRQVNKKLDNLFRVSCDLTSLHQYVEKKFNIHLPSL